MTLLDARAVILIAATSAIIATGALYALYKLRKQPAVAMASFQLQPENVMDDYRRLYYANVFQACVMLVYGTAALLDYRTISNVALTWSVLYGLVVANIFYRWGRRF